MTIRILTILALSVFAGANAFAATNLDNGSTISSEQAALAKDLPGTVIVRVDQKTGEASVLETNQTLSQDTSTVAALHAADYKKISTAGPDELDRVSSTSSWFAWHHRGHYYAPTYYYYGFSYAYTPCYQYTYGGYYYSWYRWYW